MALDDTPFVECELILDYGSATEAVLVSKAVSIDNPDYVTIELRGNSIRSRIRASSINSLSITLEDYLACLAVAEKTIGQVD